MEKEWAEFAPFLNKYFEGAKSKIGQPRHTISEFTFAADKYEQMTGYRPFSFDYCNYLRLSRFGSECPKCKNLFRTPQAKKCMKCGFELPDGETAGPFIE